MTATSVDEVVLHRVRLPLRRPHVAAHGREERREVVLVSVAAGGVTGWGECPALSTPGYSDETIDRAWVALRDELGPALRRTGTVAGGSGPMARGALADALLDRSVRAGEAALPGAAPPVDVVPFGSVVAVDGGVEAVVAAARDAVAAGAALLVVKIRPGWSTAPLAAVLDAVDGPVAVDANGSFGASDLDELRRLGALGPAFVEQPAPPADLPLSARFQAVLDVPIALDEAVADRTDLDRAVAGGAARVLTVKPARVGGLAAAWDLADRAAAAGWGVHVGGMLESGLGRATARRLAARGDVIGPGLVGPTDLLFTDDVVDPVGARADGRIPLPPAGALAPAPDPERLARLTVDRVRVT
ncbi:MAG: hypothetical protein GXY13_01335 [Acidimicrobiales bacterium]|nr:hypothetical protein [Acidimicrobiales bacterium]